MVGAGGRPQLIFKTIHCARKVAAVPAEKGFELELGYLAVAPGVNTGFDNLQLLRAAGG